MKQFNVGDRVTVSRWHPDTYKVLEVERQHGITWLFLDSGGGKWNAEYCEQVDPLLAAINAANRSNRNERTKV